MFNNRKLINKVMYGLAIVIIAGLIIMTVSAAFIR